MPEYRKKLENARSASKIHTLLDAFFVDETTSTLNNLVRCTDSEVFECRAYLKALHKLEESLQNHINTHKIEDLRRRHARD